MSPKRIFFLMMGVLGLLVVLMGATIVLGDKFLQKQSGKLLNLKLENQVIESQQTALLQAKKDIQTYSELESIAKQIVPQDKDQARATRELINIANQSGVKIASIGFPASTLGQPMAKPTAPVTDSTTPSTAPATTVAPPSVTQVKPVVGIKNLYQLDIVVTSDTNNPTTYARLIDFLSRLEQNRRTAQVSQISIQPDPVNRNVLNFTLTITLYTKP